MRASYEECYRNESFVRVLEKDVVPQTRWVEGSNFADVNFKIDPRTKRIVMMGAIDNWFVPPLVIERQHVDEMIEKLEQAIFALVP